MRMLLEALWKGPRFLAGASALDNAARELRRTTLSTAELDAQLARLLDVPPRRAA